MAPGRFPGHDGAMTQTSGGRQTTGRRPGGTDTFLDGLRRIDMRRSEDGWLGGVCAGLAARLGLDPLVIRALFAVLGLALGIGVLIYLAAWLLVPDWEEDVHLEMALRDGEAGSVVLLIATILSFFGSFGWFGGGWFLTGGAWGGGLFWGLLTLTLVVGGGVWLWSEWRARPDPGFYGRQAPARPPAAPQDTAPVGDALEGEPAAADPAAAATQPTWPGSGATAWSPSPVTATPERPEAPASRPAKPPKPPKRLGRRSAGAAGTLLGTGLALAVGAGLYWATTEYDVPGNALLVGIAGALATLGLVILILGLVGRTSGFPGFLAVLALICTVLFLPLADHFVPSGRMGEYTWTPRTAAELTDDSPFQVGAGNGTLDLHGLSPEELDGETIEASVGFGQLVIDLPEDLTVRIEAGTAGGVIRSYEDDTSYIGGLNVHDDITIGDGPADLVITARVGFGEILLKGADR